jgi:hypothetical protein
MTYISDFASLVRGISAPYCCMCILDQKISMLLCAKVVCTLVRVMLKKYVPDNQCCGSESGLDPDPGGQKCPQT